MRTIGDEKEEAVSGLWRSQDMKLVNIALQRERVKRDVLALGMLGCVQFCDSPGQVTQPGHQQKEFAGEVRRAELIERELRYFEESLQRWAPRRGWGASRPPHQPPLASDPSALEKIEEEIMELYPDLTEQVNNYDKLKKNWNLAYEHWQVLKTHRLREFVERRRDRSSDSNVSLNIIAGTLVSDKVGQFKRLCYKATKNFCEVHIIPLKHPSELGVYDTISADDDLIEELMEDPDTGRVEERCIFMAFYAAASIGLRVKRIAVSLDARIVLENIPAAEELDQQERQQRENMDGTAHSVQKVQNFIIDTLQKRIHPNMHEWQQAALIHKSVAHVLNTFTLKPHTAMATAWIPANRLKEVQEALASIDSGGGNTFLQVVPIPSTMTPPTHFETNVFTSTFQGIIDSYGVPRYKEINPTVFTIVTFPWLFGIMFGDIGHGAILLLLAIVFVLCEKQLGKMQLNEMVDMVFGARYVLLLMGLFAMYSGFLYNDYFGLMLGYSNSGYTFPPGNGTIRPEPLRPSSTPAFGMDYAWTEAENRIEFLNSYKMKNAIIIGIVQMNLGLVLSGLNHYYFKDQKHIYFGFIPETIFLACTFGYMALIIVIKWCSRFPIPGEIVANPPLSPPNLLETMTKFFLAFGKTNPETEPLYPGQEGVQAFLLLVAIAAALAILIPIPYIEWKYQQKLKQKHSDDEERSNVSYSEMTSLMRPGAVEQEMMPVGGAESSTTVVIEDLPPRAEVPNMTEVMIKQVIHTIEYVLGSVSNTASYLRLWALSLAHAQLSEVFLGRVMIFAFRSSSSGVVLYLAFGVWFSCTLGVLVAMEGLSAFLHALRLHWVEFQGKFYYADGVPFTPLCFHSILRSAGLPAMRH